LDDHGLGVEDSPVPGLLHPRWGLVVICAGSPLACGHDHDAPALPTTVDEFLYDCENPRRPPQLTVFATDESLVKMLEKEDAGAILHKDEGAATLLNPLSGATLSSASPPEFALVPPTTSTRLGPVPAGPRISPLRLPAPAPHVSPAHLLRRALTWLGHRLAPIATAYAHCTPVTGDNYLVRLGTGDNPQIYAALTSVTTFTPNPAIWKKALAGRAGQTVTLTLLRASYSGGTITDGPFAGGQVVSFTIGP
jgi:hypothetical protein